MNIQDIIAGSVKNLAGNIQVPENLKNQVVNGLSDSILGSLKQTATQAGGLDAIKALVSGKTAAASSPVTALAGKLFAGNIASKLGLNTAQTSSATAIIPNVFGKFSQVLKDQDGDGDVDLKDIIMGLTGAGAGASKGSSILGAATSILGGILGKK